MKMSSWIFLMISALMIVSGLFLCKYARSKAPNDAAIDGYTTTDNGQSYTELDYSYQRVNKVTLSLSDCKVEIRGGAEEAKLELIGFKPNSYIGNVTGKTIKVSNQLSILDYFSFDGSGVAFAGVWRTLNSMMGEQSDSTPEVILHIPDDQDIQQYNLTFNNCVVSIVNLKGESEYSILSTDSTIEFNSISSSLADLVCDDSEVTMVSAAIEHITYEINGGSLVTSKLSTEDVSFTGKEGDINLIDADFVEFTLKMEECNLTLASIFTQGSYQRNIKLEKGEIYLGDLLVGAEDVSPEDETIPGKITITLDNGKVVTKYGSTQLVIEEDLPETAEPSTSEPSTAEPETSESEK